MWSYGFSNFFHIFPRQFSENEMKNFLINLDRIYIFKKKNQNWGCTFLRAYKIMLFQYFDKNNGFFSPQQRIVDFHRIIEKKRVPFL